MRKRAADFFNNFISALETDLSSKEIWNNEGMKLPVWTKVATNALCEAVRADIEFEMPPKYTGTELCVAARGSEDNYGRSEYFNIDIIGYSNDWSVPLIGVEHENWRRGVRYALWKLLVTRIELRVLVAYTDPSCTEPRCILDRAALCRELEEVFIQHAGIRVLIISGKWQEDPTLERGWRQVFEAGLVHCSEDRILDVPL